MKFLITGGSGFLGINLVRHLLRNNHEISVMDIAPFNYSDCKKNIIFFQNDIRDTNALNSIIPGHDVIVHCAAALPLYPAYDIYTTNAYGTRNILKSAIKHKIPRVIHISSTAVYGIPNIPCVPESHHYDGVGPYGKAKIQAEKYCFSARNKGLCVPILRPKSFIGPERLGIFAMLYQWADEGKHFPVPGNGKNRYQLLDVEDLCRVILLCSELPEATVNTDFNIAAENYTTLYEDFQSVLDSAGHGKKIIPLPASPVITALRILDRLKLSPVYPWIYETIVKDSFVSTDRAAKILGFHPRYSNKDALLRNFKWYLKHKNSISETSGVSHRVNWNQQILALAKYFF